MPPGDVFKRRTFTFGFGTGSESTEVRLKPDFDTVLAWRKKAEEGKDWHEIDLNDVKAIEAKGDKRRSMLPFQLLIPGERLAIAR